MGVLAFSCVKDDALYVENHFMDYEIPIIPVETDYVVGAHYTKFTLRTTVTETPSIGAYNTERGDPTAYAQHIAQAQTGGIDYFLFDVRSTLTPAQFSTDSTFIDTLQMASNASSMNFALSYNVGSLGLSNDDRIEGQGLVATFLKDFEKMKLFFDMSNYMKVDGKCVVKLQNNHNFHSDDNAALIQQLRSQMSGMGVELFLIGYQNEWTPPLRYDFRLQNCVDATTHGTYANLSENWYDRYIMYHKMCDQAWSFHQVEFEKIGIEYVPTISPSYNPKLNNPGSGNHVFEKNTDWFKAHCNVARKVAGEHKLIILDSFNDWNRDTQVESATSYGESYLTILKQEFKTN
jgi:hypothetical protein